MNSVILFSFVCSTDVELDDDECLGGGGPFPWRAYISSREGPSSRASLSSRDGADALSVVGGGSLVAKDFHGADPLLMYGRSNLVTVGLTVALTAPCDSGSYLALELDDFELSWAGSSSFGIRGSRWRYRGWMKLDTTSS